MPWGEAVIERGRRRPARVPVAPLLLRFRDQRQERAFRRDYADHILGQSRLALLLAAMLYLFMGLEDPLFYGGSFTAIWLLRAGAALLLIAVLAMTRLSWYRRHHQAVLTATVLMAGVGVYGMIGLGGEAVRQSYYFGIVLVVVWAYTCSGLRFANALAVNVLLVAGYLVVVTALVPIAPMWLLATAARLFAASLIAGFAGYTIEWQRRALYDQTAQIDLELRSHKRQATRDVLTGLPNRLAFEQRLAGTEARARRSGHPFAVLFVDINDFKPVNDSHGHRVGDRVLEMLGQRLHQTTREADLVARFGGDEFVVLVEDLDAATAAIEVAEKLHAAIRPPFRVSADDAVHVVHITASIGIACYPEDGEDADALVPKADEAMYRAKADGGGSRRYGHQEQAEEEVGG